MSPLCEDCKFGRLLLCLFKIMAFIISMFIDGLSVIIYIQMKCFVLFLFLLFTQTSSQLITATLTLVQYEPFVFQLTFSEPISKPDFQLLLDNLYQLNYTFITNDSVSSTFFFQMVPFSLPPGETLESYQLIFNSPLHIGSGRMGVNYFMITAHKVIVEIDFSQTLGLLAILATYVIIHFTVLGLTLIEFLQVYSLIMFKNQIKTMLYHQISKDLLLLNPVLADGTYGFRGAFETIVFAPILIVLSIGLLGYIVKHFISKPQSISKQIFYEGVVYNLFVTINTVLIVPLFFNAIEFYLLCQQQIISSSKTEVAGSVVSYLNLVAAVFIVYLFVYVLNPKKGESKESWKKYLKSGQFTSFRRLHEVLIWNSWYKRNMNVLIILKRIMIAALFFWDSGFEVMVFLLEFVNIFYIFTANPFRYQVYMNISVISRLFMFLFYGIVVLGNLYYSLGTITVNYQSTKNFLYARDTIFLLIVIFIFLFTFYEIYNKCSNLNYQIRLVREENEFKLKFIEKQEGEIEETSKRNQHKSIGDSQGHSYDRNSRYTTYDSSPKKRRENSLEKKVNLRNRVSRKNQQKIKSIEMEEKNEGSLPVKLQVEATRERADSLVNSESKQDRRREKHKWKKESLLAAILKQK